MRYMLSVSNGFAAYPGGMSFENKLYCLVAVGFLVLSVLGAVVGLRVKSVFAEYRTVAAACGLTAAETARRVLDENGLYHVSVTRVAGELTDHFDPRTQTIALSDSVYSSRSVAAIGVACHEVGHAVQHAKKFFFSGLRLRMVPVLNFANGMLMPLLTVGIVLGFATPYTALGRVLVWAGVVVFGLSMLFALVTLPTEFDASRRAQKALQNGYFSAEELACSRRVLRAAAMTYVVSFLLSLLQFLRFVALLLSAQRRR